MSHRKPPDDFRPEDSPIAWFGEMLIAIDRGDFERAAESQRRLDCLGWRVTRERGHHKPRNGPTREKGEDHPIAWFSALVRGLDRNDKGLVAEAERRLERLGFIVVPTLPTDTDRKGVA